MRLNEPKQAVYLACLLLIYFKKLDFMNYILNSSCLIFGILIFTLFVLNALSLVIHFIKNWNK